MSLLGSQDRLSDFIKKDTVQLLNRTLYRDARRCWRPQTQRKLFTHILAGLVWLVASTELCEDLID